MSLWSAGLRVGRLWEIRQSAARPLAFSNPRLRINSVLNGVTRRGTLGNPAGVLGRLASDLPTLASLIISLIYNIVNSSIDSWRGNHDIWSGMAAGGLCGAVYKSTGHASFHIAPISIVAHTRAHSLDHTTRVDA